MKRNKLGYGSEEAMGPPPPISDNLKAVPILSNILIITAYLAVTLLVLSVPAWLCLPSSFPIPPLHLPSISTSLFFTSVFLTCGSMIQPQLIWFQVGRSGFGSIERRVSTICVCNFKRIQNRLGRRTKQE